MIITPPAIDLSAARKLYRLTGANFNTTADQALERLHGFSAFKIMFVFVGNSSISLTTAAGGFYTGAAKSGVIIVAASQAYSSITGATTTVPLTLATTARARLTADPILALTTAQGAPATADIEIIGYAAE